MPVGLDVLRVGLLGGLGGCVEKLKLGSRAGGAARPASDLSVGVGVESVAVQNLAGGGVELWGAEAEGVVSGYLPHLRRKAATTVRQTPAQT